MIKSGQLKMSDRHALFTIRIKRKKISKRIHKRHALFLYYLIRIDKKAFDGDAKWDVRWAG